MLPAHLASGGRAVLAMLPEEAVTALFSTPESPVADLTQLLRDLRRVRRQGFAINEQKTETGVTAIGCVVPGPADAVPAAVSVAMPTVRYRRDRLAGWTQNLTTTAERIGRELEQVAGRPVGPH
jgi:IclR family transcriptional regulator, acetate operon repressor